MNKMNIFKIVIIGLGLLFVLNLNIYGKAAKTAYPDPEVIDRVTHDYGNLATTIDNYGYIGGYSTLYPSGEWPRNSGHDYIAEIYYWMGAVTPAGDTVVLTSVDDFAPLPSLLLEDDPYKILMSTDTNRFDYDPNDTIGTGIGNPANGWRVYDPDSSDWVYNKVYSTADSTFHSAGPTALQQSFYRFNDGNSTTPLGLEMTHTVCQWNYCYNEDILFVIVEITNTSTNDYPDFAFGLYCDFDIGGINDEGGNGRLHDLVATDIDENLAWTYDDDYWDEGWNDDAGIMGTKYLETPDNIGMTAFRTDQWELIPTTPQGKYALINSDQYDTSLPPTDQYYIQCTKGINLTAGKTVKVVFAIIAGANEEEFLDNAATAQTLYDNNYVGPQPPTMPTLKANVGDHSVHLYWGDTSEVGYDVLSGENDFKGYKLYRSSNLGYSWGTEVRPDYNSCLDVDYKPIATFQINDAGDPIAHSFIDSNLTNGFEYWYCLVAFDKGDTNVPIGPLQNGFGNPNLNSNVVSVTPRSNPAGFVSTGSSITHTNILGGDLSDGQILPEVFIPDETMDDEYYVTFTEDDFDTYWNLIRVDESTNDTTYVIQDQNDFGADPTKTDIVEGLRLVVTSPDDRMPSFFDQTGFATAGDTTLHEGDMYGRTLEALAADESYWGPDKNIRDDYEIRFTDGGSIAYSWWDGVTPITVPFEVWNTTQNQQVYCEIYDFMYDNTWDVADGDLLAIINRPYDEGPNFDLYPFYYSWLFGFSPNDTSFATGDILSIDGAPMNGPDDVFTFKIDGVDASRVGFDMSKIRTSPDPYVGRSTLENSRHERMLKFINLPEVCTIRIYTLAGDLINTIEHQGAGTAVWDMLTKDGLSIASGIYIYHVESEYGSHMGRFAVIL